MKKQVKAYRLPTEDRSHLIEFQGKLNYGTNAIWNDDRVGYLTQHIYITVSQGVEPIVADCYVLSKKEGYDLQQVPKNMIESYSKCKHYQKIIATSDESLGIKNVSQDFIKAFVESGGKEDWEVEMEEHKLYAHGPQTFLKLKLDSENCVILSAIITEKTTFGYDDITHAVAYGHSMAKQGLSHHQTLINYKEANNIKYVSAVEEKMYSKDKFIESLHSYWDKMHGKGHQNISMINWIKENL